VSPAATIKPSAPTKLTLVLALVVTAFTPGTAHANSGYSAVVSTSLPTGTLNTEICGDAADVGGLTVFWSRRTP
jgi:hypothetical protein